MRAWIAGLALGLTACASAPDMSPVNSPRSGPPQVVSEDDGIDGDAIALAFSGGGARAASFSYGVLLGLHDMKDAGGGRLIDRVALVTAVSGGSITAAYFGQHGADDLGGYRAILDKDWLKQVHTSAYAPGNWTRLLQGGLNGRDRIGDWLDREVYSGGRMRDLRARPRIVINATDLFNGVPFAFTEPYLQAICSDEGSVRIADAVAASMAVPLAMRPTTMGAYPEACAGQPLPDWVDQAAADRSAPVMLRETAKAFRLYRETTKMKYVHLVDGGVTDNLGLASLTVMRRASAAPYAPFSARDAVKLRRLAFVVVNAEKTTMGDWAMDEQGPDGIETAGALVDVTINAPKRQAYDAFRSMLQDWRRDLVTYRCGLSAAEAAGLGAGAGWKCDDVEIRLDMISFADLPGDLPTKLGSADTTVSLPTDLVDALIAGGRTAVETNPLARSLMSEPVR